MGRGPNSEQSPRLTPRQPCHGRHPPASRPCAAGAGANFYSAQPAQSVGPTAAALDIDPNHRLQRRDIVSFAIAQDREQPQIMRVTDTGELDFSEFPKIGRISVVGKTCGEVAAELKRKLEADYYNAADVRLGINQVAAAHLARKDLSFRQCEGAGTGGHFAGRTDDGQHRHYPRGGFR